jgi:uncharacterized membrane protein (DUF485 family)
MVLHQANQNTDDEGADVGIRNARIGWWLFLVYAALYAGFMLLNTFAPTATAAIVLFGLNLAVCYGIGLIVVAVLMALLYGWLCKFPLTDSQSRESSQAAERAR